MGTKMALGDVALMVHRMNILELGIHPNLHNLAMLIGHLFLKLPFGTVIYRANLMTVVFGAASAIAFYFLLHKMKLNYFVTLISSFVFMISHSIWWHATMAENYIIHVFMIIIIITCFVDYTQSKRIWPIHLAFFMAGLSFFNHVQNGVWFGACYLFLIFNYFDIQKNGITPPVYRKMFKDNRKPFFFMVFLASSIFLLIGLLPYLIVFFKAYAARGYNIAKTFNTGSGGEFKSIMLNFDNMTGFYQSFWYHFLQVPSFFYFLTVAGLLYFLFGYPVHRLVKSSSTISNSEKWSFYSALAITASIAVMFAVFFYNGTIFQLGGSLIRWFRYDFSIRFFVINAVISLILLVFLQRLGHLKNPLKRNFSKVFYSIIIVPFFVTLLFFQFYNTWDQFQFLLPCFIIFAVCGACFFDDIVEIIKNNFSAAHKKIFYGVFFAAGLFSIFSPVYLYENIGKWGVDPSSWWFDYGPYSDQRFLNSHNRSEYNNNPDKHNYNDVDDFVNLLFEKVPQNATIIDDDSRMFYPIQLYYRQYAERADKGRPDINLSMINVWGHKNWGTTVNRVVEEVNSVLPGEENFFLMADRNYPHSDIIHKLNSNDRIFLPWKLSNDRWIYKLKVFTEEEKKKMNGYFPPINFHYLYFGRDFDKNGLNIESVFTPSDRIDIRAVFDRLPRKSEPFEMAFSVNDSAGKELFRKAVNVKGGWKGISLPLDPESRNLTNGTYEVVVSIKEIEIFRRSFQIE